MVFPKLKSKKVLVIAAIAVLGVGFSLLGSFGPTAYAASPADTGAAGAKAKKSKTDTCGKFSKAADKNACEKSFDAGSKATEDKSKYYCGDDDKTKVGTYFDFSQYCKGTNPSAGGNQSPIIAIGLTVVGWMTALVAVAVVGGIVYGGFLYLSARDNTSQTQKGLTVIGNSVVALVAWVFAYAIINFLVPGGLFNG